MKLNGVALAALLALSEGLEFGNVGTDQINFKIPDQITPGAEKQGIFGFWKQQASNLLNDLATELGQRVEDIPKEASKLWAQVLTEFPNALDDLTFSTAKLLANRYKGHVLDRNDWLYVVSDKKLPGHALKVKSPESLKVDTVKQYSGYLEKKEEDKHFFYWFFESRNDPKNDPIILWLNGGPGCSSLTGLFFELGPASINEKLEPVHNPYSWNNNASVIFLDQPVNTGYSYSTESTVSDTVTAAQDVYAFLSLFFKQFPEYLDLDFHIAGESYAGHYLPQIGVEIMSHEDRIFDLKSVLIGNGLTDPLRQYEGYQPMACGEGGHPAVVDEQGCESMKQKLPNCLGMIEGCYSLQSTWVCVPAAIYCNNAMFGPYQQTGLNVYDVRKQCETDGGLCYKGLDYVDAYLNLPEVMKAVGSEIDEYQGCNMEVNQNFLFKGDWMMPNFYLDVIELLDTYNLPVLIYAGDKDFICNWVGNEIYTSRLEWSKGEEFGSTSMKLYVSNITGEEAGQVRNVDKFTFLRLFEAGHMCPYDQPENSLDMLNRWVRGDYALGS